MTHQTKIGRESRPIELDAVLLSGAGLRITLYVFVCRSVVVRGMITNPSTQRSRECAEPRLLIYIPSRNKSFAQTLFGIVELLVVLWGRTLCINFR
jgi:hypothetical protein